MLWNLGLVAVLIWVDRRKVLKPGRLIWVYVGGYAIGRLWIETLRIDRATEIAGVRINLWTMGILLLASLVMLRNARLGQAHDDHDQHEAGDEELADELDDDQNEEE